MTSTSEDFNGAINKYRHSFPPQLQRLNLKHNLPLVCLQFTDQHDILLWFGDIKLKTRGLPITVSNQPGCSLCAADPQPSASFRAVWRFDAGDAAPAFEYIMPGLQMHAQSVRSAGTTFFSGLYAQQFL